MDKNCCQGSFRLEYNCRLSSALRRPRKNWSLTSVSSQLALRPSSIIASAYAFNDSPGSCRRETNLARASRVDSMGEYRSANILAKSANGAFTLKGHCIT
ncbi:hypothetical protein T4D_3411 [Trichinella pseudospiralis]|uniref:Uncharacterized protein n=1 Tax=Trichinella pseudospiralis TaxID=6337 RepID=A0A0V1FZE4_TRIPS|nr:hypothetical protein T4D_3411 [Trichinella pseudospiralis]